MDYKAGQDLTSTIKPLWQALNEKVLPWASDKNQPRCIIATPTIREFREKGIVLPEGVSISARARQGKRVRLPRKQQRIRGDSKHATYLWPEEGLISKRAPQLACIINGRSNFPVGDYFLHVPAGYFIIIPPGVPYPDGSRSHIEGKGSCDILWLTLWSDVLRCWICRSLDDEHLPSESSASCFLQEGQARNYFQALAGEATELEAGYLPVCENLMAVLWTVVHRRISQGRFFKNAGLIITEEGPLLQGGDPIVLAQQYIRSHIHRPLTMADVARRVYLSRAQFARRFHSETGQTFTTFVTECRIHEASRLLLETEWPLSTISELTGITPAHLRDIFLRHTGQSPLEFRRVQRAAALQ